MEQNQTLQARFPQFVVPYLELVDAVACHIQNQGRTTLLDGYLLSSVRGCSLVRTGTSSMPVKTKIDSTSRTGPLRQGKVRKEFWLNPSLLRRAQKELGAASEREAVEMALSLVSFRRELRSGVRALRKLKLSRID